MRDEFERYGSPRSPRILPHLEKPEDIFEKQLEIPEGEDAPLNIEEYRLDTSSWKGGSGGVVVGFSRLDFQSFRYISYGQ